MNLKKDKLYLEASRKKNMKAENGMDAEIIWEDSKGNPCDSKQ